MRITLTHKTRINGFVGILVIIGTLSPFPHLEMSLFDVFIEIYDLSTIKIASSLFVISTINASEITIELTIKYGFHGF